MIFLGILMILLGVAFAAMGYLIAFQKRYALINHFVDDRHRGKFDDTYAKRMGLIEMLCGVVSVVFGILVLCIRSVPFTWTVFLIVLIGTAAAIAVNTLFSMKAVK